ncbi:DNA-binding protein [Pseudonocardia sp. N23]|uniref:DNA-binding protein n=1 Tax=Pseudonocardia sp. N23 TaxID=1987376 RepID=UPI000BFEA4BB|nr:DNA-binding protein [Pseudonocardia sp. N23]GAY12764.1 transcriptional activator of acetoin/glycerol metabolism [Pseudonocardia sp. N23]
MARTALDHPVDRWTTRAAWERFAAGEDDVRGVAPAILASWYRCRDVHNVDPRHHRPTGPADGDTPGDGGVFARLGGVAAEVAEFDDRWLATVTDGAGRIVASWGSSAARLRGERARLTPSFGWDESASGTNGMGTALVEQTPVSVQGPEHWCEALHSWSCAGVAVRDQVSGAPVASLNVSAWCGAVPVLPAAAVAELAAIRAILRRRAVRDGAEVADAFAARPGADGPLLAVDTAGGVVAAGEVAHRRFPDVPVGVHTDPSERWRPVGDGLRAVVTRAVAAAEAQPGWTGSADLGSALGGASEVLGLVPVRVGGRVVGLLLGAGPGDDTAPRVATGNDVARVPTPDRVAATRDGRMLLLAPAEIRFAEADGHTVWLATDVGRVRAVTRGIDRVAAQLAPFGFARIHRSYLVNVARIREVNDNGRGALTVSTQLTRNERIPVSRRNALVLRETFGF